MDQHLNKWTWWVFSCPHKTHQIPYDFPQNSLLVFPITKLNLKYRHNYQLGSCRQVDHGVYFYAALHEVMVYCHWSQNNEHEANFQLASKTILLKPEELCYAYLLLSYPCRCSRYFTTAKTVLALKSMQSNLRLEMTALQGAGPGERTRSLFS